MSACNWRSATPRSVLVVMVENLGFNSFSCGESADFESGSGLQIFCEESVRFTHAYTPSLMTQAAVASILTAKAPYEHGVRNNGPDALLASEDTLAEVALAKGFRTGFFSGGPPVFRRSGINQGFELFDDSFKVDYKKLYRPAVKMFSAFLSWLQLEPSRPFLSFVYIADLQFIDVPTTNELGELRENSYRAQLDVVDEALGGLARDLKKRKLWDSTDIFLVGLNGNPAESRAGELSAVDLFSDRTRTVLMAKPARQNRESPFNWKIDNNVSLMDLGVTILDLLGHPPKPVINKAAPAVSLRSVLDRPEADWDDDREIVSESAWGAWRKMGEIRAALRKGPFLYLFDERDQLYNTLTDNFEALPLPRKDELSISRRQAMAKFLSDLGYRPWRPLPGLEIEKAALGRELWLTQLPFKESLAAFRKLSRKSPEDSELRGWRALFALRQDAWRELKTIAAAVGPGPVHLLPEETLWSFVASKNLGEKVAIPTDPCLSFLRNASTAASASKSRKVDRDCERAGVRELVDWSNESLPETERSRAMELFMRFYLQHALETRVAEYNEVAGRTWDTPTGVTGPDEVDLILALPEMRKVQTQVRARLAAIRQPSP